MGSIDGAFSGLNITTGVEVPSGPGISSFSTVMSAATLHSWRVSKDLRASM